MFQILKIQRFDIHDRYFRFDHRRVWSRWKLSEIVFLTTYISMIKFLFCTVLPPGASKVDQTHKFDYILDLIQFFKISPNSVLIEMNDINNVIWNNLEYHDQLPKVHRFLLLKLTKNDFFWIFFCKIAEFCQLQRLLERKRCAYN